MGLLLGKGSDVSAKDDSGSTPLHFAVSFGRQASARLLLDHGADVSAMTDQGLTPELLATTGADHSLAAMLRDEAARRAWGVADPMPEVHGKKRPSRKAQVRKGPISECVVVLRGRLQEKKTL